VVSKLFSADPKGFATCSKVIRGYISVMASLKFDYFLNKKYFIFVKNNCGNSLIGDIFTSYGD
jgi:hypothetical protein